jgi:ribonuclease HI
MKKIYTDGACSGNPGPGGWAVIISENKNIIDSFGGFAPQTTNNKMELRAAIEALKTLKPGEPAAIFTDSQYVKNGITEWLPNWKLKNWKTANKKPVKNQEFWRQLDTLNHAGIQWHWLAGHAGNELNEKCDLLARSFIEKHAF